MAAVRFAAVFSVVLAAALSAQTASTSEVTITVVDPIGAVISGAHVGIIQLPDVIPNDGDWLDYALTAPEQISQRASAYGEATADLINGSYVVKIVAPGWRLYLNKIEIPNTASESIRAVLTPAPVVNWGPFRPQIPLEPVSLNALIPTEPVPAFEFSRKIRRHWFH